MYNHYYKVNQDGFITRGFSTAHEKPSQSDILKGNNLGGHFDHSEVLIDKEGYFLFKKSSTGKKVKATKDEQPLFQKKQNQINLEFLQETDWMVTRYLEQGPTASFTDAQYEQLKVDRQAARGAVIKGI